VTNTNFGDTLPLGTKYEKWTLYHGITYKPVVLNRGGSASKIFQGCASPYARYNLGSFIIKFTNK